MLSQREASELKTLKKRLLVAGCGNYFLGDDGFGPAVVKELEKKGLGESVELLDAGVDETLLVKALGKCDAAIIVDAARKKGAAAGELFEAGLSDERIDSGLSVTPLGTHGFDLFHALKTAKGIGKTPKKILLVGTPPQKLEGNSLSPACRAAVEKAVEMIFEMAAEWEEKRALTPARR